jgi:outer membrane protein TolC
MRTVIVLTFVCLQLPAGAQPPEGRRFTLDQLVDESKRSLRGEPAREALRAADARRDEARALWIPHLDVTAIGGPGPEIRCMPSPDECTRTNVNTPYRVGDQPTFRVDATLTVPIYTFGKLSNAREAADQGVAAAKAGVEINQADLTLDAVRVYYGLKFAREILIMLDEGRRHVLKELERVEKELDKGKTNVSEYDRFRMKSLLAEIDARRSETERSIADQLVAIRSVTGNPADDIDDAPLAELPDVGLGTLAEAKDSAQTKRPETRAVKAGVLAQEHITRIENLRWLPDFVLRLGATIARDPGADIPSNAFYNNQLNVTGYWAVLALQWSLDGTRPAKVAQANIDLDRARTSENLVAMGVGWEAQSAWNAARDARRRLEAVRDGERAAHSWVVAVMQNTELGTAEPRDLNEALQAYFVMHARLYWAMDEWNVGLIAFARATGRDWREFLPKP